VCLLALGRIEEEKFRRLPGSRPDQDSGRDEGRKRTSDEWSGLNVKRCPASDNANTCYAAKLRHLIRVTHVAANKLISSPDSRKYAMWNRAVVWLTRSWRVCRRNEDGLIYSSLFTITVARKQNNSTEKNRTTQLTN